MDRAPTPKPPSLRESTASVGWIGTLPAPARAERVVPYVEGGRIVLVAEDELGIQTVRVYEVIRP